MSSIIKRIINRKKRSIEKNKVEKILQLFQNKSGLEIGGSTKLFSTKLPIYKIIKQLDNSNFSDQTIWNGQISEGNFYNYFEDKKGFQYIREASNLAGIASEKYDFIVASHVLEHCANVIKTVKEWLRVIKKDGVILIIVPYSKVTFDHKRTVTKFSHLLDDYKENTEENDLTHLDEIIALHDLSLDTSAGDIENFKKRSLNNFANRCLHHHVFNFSLLQQIFRFLKIKTVAKLFIGPNHQIIIGLKK